MTAFLIFASVAATIAHAAEDREGEETPRFFFTSTGTNSTSNVAFDPNSIIYIGLIALGIFGVIALVGFFSEEAKEEANYIAPT